MDIYLQQEEALNTKYQQDQQAVDIQLNSLQNQRKNFYSQVEDITGYGYQLARQIEGFESSKVLPKVEQLVGQIEEEFYQTRQRLTDKLEQLRVKYRHDANNLEDAYLMARRKKDHN